LFVREDSVYKGLDCNAWDRVRDARKWPGGSPIVAHPPCRAWGGLRAFSKAGPEEKALGPWAVDLVRFWGGVLEHPAKSSLWAFCGLPRPSQGRDSYGGFTLAVPQSWWGHRAEKWTWLYIVGLAQAELPEIPFSIGEATHVIASSKKRQALRLRPEVTKREREATPPYSLNGYSKPLAAAGSERRR
jgi:hypothetical protein